MVLVLLPLLLSCGVDQRATGLAARDFNVVLLVLDACRSDKLGSYGFPRAATPHLDALARDPDAAVFLRHYVQATWTKPSTASLFTGLFLHQHGVDTEHQRSGAGPDVYTTDVLSEEYTTLAEGLRDLGFETFAVVRSPHLVPEYGFSQGFQHYLTKQEVRSEQRNVSAFRALVEAATHRFFGYLHVNGCHYPFPRRLRDKGYMRRYGFPYDETARRAAGLDFTTSRMKTAIRSGQIPFDDADRRFLHLVYEAQLRLIDRRVVAALVRLLRERGVYDDTLLIVTADHGEELYDHQGFAHSHALWDEVIHVPLIVKFPKGGRPDALARQVMDVTNAADLMPSILALVDPSTTDEGSAAIFSGRQRGYALAERGSTSALVQGDYKLIEGESGSRLFRLSDDPREKHDRAALEPQRVEAMRAFVRDLRRSFVEAPRIETELDAPTIRQLRSLGYLDPDDAPEAPSGGP